MMSSSEESSRYIPPHRRQQSCTKPAQTTTTPRRFQQASPSLPSSTRNNRRRPRDSSSFTTPPKLLPTALRFSTLSAVAPAWTPNTNNTQPLTNHDNVQQAESLFTRIVCINLIRRSDRWQTFHKRMRTALNPHHHPFCAKVERFAAVDGQEVLPENVLLEWDATQNSRYDKHIQPPMAKQMTPGEVGCAMSHVQLWKELAEIEPRESNTNNMLILEDDAILYQPKSTRRRQSPHKANHNKHGTGRYGDSSFTPKHNNWRTNSFRSIDASPLEEDSTEDDDSGRIRSIMSTDTACFIPALLDVWKILPEDWDILYLGFSDRGERRYISPTKRTSLPVTLFRPTYGFHTHAYALGQRAAKVLLEHLPVQGPLDVWLADNQWFGLNVYCAVVEDGTSFKGKLGAQLISQQRHNIKSDIGMSGRVSL